MRLGCHRGHICWLQFFSPMADHCPSGDLTRLRAGGLALLDGNGAPGRVRAGTAPLAKKCWQAANGDDRATRRFAAGGSFKQAPGVRVTGGTEYLFTRTALNDPTSVHDCDVAASTGNRSKIVRQHHERRANVMWQSEKNVQDLVTYRAVQRRSRLVSNDKRGPAGNRHRDYDPLRHSAG